MGLLEGYCDEAQCEDEMLALDLTTAAQGHHVIEDHIPIV